MCGPSPDALGLKHFEGRVWSNGYVSDIRRLTATFWEDDGVVEGDLQNNTFRMGYLGTPPRWLLGYISPEKGGVNYECLESTKQRVA